MQIQHRLAPFIRYRSGAEDAVAHCLQMFGADQGRIEQIDLARLLRVCAG